jgi:hypothetical protein
MPGGMKLVRIGSSYYENIIKMVKKEEENKEKKLLSKTKLQVGNVYRVGRSYYVFLGFVSTIGAKKARGSANTTYIKHNKACLWYNCYAGTTNVLQSIQADLTSITIIPKARLIVFNIGGICRTSCFFCTNCRHKTKKYIITSTNPVYVSNL